MLSHRRPLVAAGQETKQGMKRGQETTTASETTTTMKNNSNNSSNNNNNPRSSIIISARQHSKGQKPTKRKRRTLWIKLFGIFVFNLTVINVFWGHSQIDSLQQSYNEDNNGNQVVAPPSQQYSWRTTKNNNNNKKKKKPTNHACDGYNGIYHIEKGDIGGAAGTIFFQFVIGQLIWAEKYNFKPWVYLNNVSYIIYDPIVHGKGPGVDFQMMKGMNISYITRPNGHWRDAYPGPPTTIEDGSNLIPNHFHFDGDGVWEDYFEPVSDFIPGDTSCVNKPLVTMDLYQVTPGIHGFAPWAPRCWRYQYLPDYVTKPHIPLQEWLEPQRHLANSVLQKYIRFNVDITRKAQQVNPSCSLDTCLGIHIRQSDKAAGRRQIETDEFLPYVEAFHNAGGKYIYLATDSGKVMDHIHTNWPKHLTSKIRSMGSDVVRSNDMKAVFDIASHHRTNTEILIEILALSYCQFLIHGLSAVTETSIWINVDLHYTSVNLEDPDHLSPKEFATMSEKVLNGANATQLDHDRRIKYNWWKQVGKNQLKQHEEQPTDNACSDNNVRGILHIQHVGTKSTAGYAFFSSILNQLYYAEKYNLKPWIYLNSSESDYIYDADYHSAPQKNKLTIDGMSDGLEISVLHNPMNNSLLFPGEPNERAISDTTIISRSFDHGSGLWNNYFDPVSDFVPGDKSCRGKPIVSLDNDMVVPGLQSYCPWSIKPWRHDDVPDDIWNVNNLSLKAWCEPMRIKAHELIKKYYKFKPHIIQRAIEVNPANETKPCLAIHLRNSDKGKNKYRSKFPVNKFREYLNAFVRAGGERIYIGTDSHRVLEYIEQHYPSQIHKMIRTQGPYVVRSTSKWPIHYVEEQHHRTNSEVLVDILAMSRCQLLLHGNSAASEAAIYLNLNLHNQSVNWEDPDKMSPAEFEILARSVLGTGKAAPVALKKDEAKTNVKQYQDPIVLRGDSSTSRRCKKNAIIYLAQKRHSSYGRDSYGILLESLELMYKNYLSLENHRDNADLIIFHTGDFNSHDLDTFESKFGLEFRTLLHLIDLSNTTYWKRPSWHENDDPFSWYAFPLFSEGYRRMMHWFAIDIWQFFIDYEKRTQCNYDYIMRFDEDSFLHSPIKYDIFDFMKQNDYYYGFRLCSYEMQVTQRIWKLWRKTKGSPDPIRNIELEMCGVYNNFFVAKLAFFQSQQVQKFLHFVDRQGMIYRRRLGDLMIHSMTIYSFAPPEKIHRFLDFTYEHITVDKESGCVVWGGIQAGYDDPNGGDTLENFHQSKVIQKGCHANLTMMSEYSLSPTYAHLPARLNGVVKLKTISAGRVELPGKGILSG